MKAFVNTLLSFFISLSFTHVYSQELGKTMKVPYVDGAILDMVQQGDTMFIAGSFTHLMHADSGGSTLMLTDSACVNLKNLGIQGAFHESPVSISDIISDGKGGWFISGGFAQIGDSVRTGLAHLDSLGRLTGKFSNSQFDGSVRKIKLHGDTLLVAGSFNSFGKNYKDYGLASLHSDSIYFRGRKPDGGIFDAVSDDEGGYFVTGYFQKYGDSLRSYFAHIDSNGNVTDRLKRINVSYSPIGKAGDLLAIECQSYFRTTEMAPVYNSDLTLAPFECPIPDYKIVDHVMNRDKSYFVGGSFRMIGDVRKAGLALIDSNHQLSSWESLNKDIQYVQHLVGNDSFLYVDATCIDSLTKLSTRKLYKIEKLSGGVVWEHNYGRRSVYDLALNNDRLYVLFYNQDNFFAPFNNDVKSVHVFDIQSNRLLEEHDLTSTGANIHQYVFSGNYLYLSGGFSSVLGINRSQFAQISLNDFQVTSLDIGSTVGPNPSFIAGDSQVYFLTTGNGSYGPNTGRGMCYDFKNSAWTNWDFQYKTKYTNNPYFQFKLGEAGVLIASTSFDSISGIPCEPLILLDRDSGNIQITLPVNDLKSNILFTKDFINLFDSKDNYFSSDYKTVKFVDSKTGALRAPGIEIGSLWNEDVERITGFGNKFVVEGKFTRANNLTVNDRFIVDTLGNVIPFDFSKFTGAIRTIAIFDTTVIVGGSITYSGAPGYALFAVGISGQQPIPGFPVFNGEVQQVVLRGNELYVLGSFSQIDTLQRKYLASIDLSTNSVTSFNPRFDYLNPIPKSMEVGGGLVHLFGEFPSLKYNGSRQYRYGYLGIDISNDSIYKHDLLVPEFNNPLLKGGVSSNHQLLFIQANSISGKEPCRYVAALNLQTEELIDWKPQPDNAVFDIAIAGNKVILGGSFYMLNGNFSPYIAFYDGLVNDPMPTTSWPNNAVMELVPCSSGVFASGLFTSVQSKPRNKIAMFDPATAALTNWAAPGLTNDGSSYAIRDSSIYFIKSNSVTRYDTGSKVEKVVARQGAYSFELTDSGFIAAGSFGKAKLGPFPGVYHQGNSPVVKGNYDTIISTHFGPRGSQYTNIVKSGNQFLIKGTPSSSGVFSGNVGAFRISTGEPIPLGIQTNDTVFRLKVHGNKLLVYGKFNRINDSVRNYVALYDLASKRITPWKLNGNTYSINSEYSMALYDDEVIFGNGPRIIDSLGAIHEGFMILDDSIGTHFKPLTIGNYWASMFYQRDSVLFFMGKNKDSALITDESELLAYDLKTDSFITLSQKPIHFRVKLGRHMYVNDSFVFIGAWGPGSYNDTLLKIVNWRTNEVKPNRMSFSGTQYEQRITSLNAYQGKLYISFVYRMYNTPGGTIYSQPEPGNFTRAIDEYSLEDDGRNERLNMRVNEIYPTDHGIAYGGEFYLGSHSNKKYLQSISENPHLFFSIDGNAWCGSLDTIFATIGLGLNEPDSIDYTVQLFKKNNGSDQLIHVWDYFLPYRSGKVKLSFGTLTEGDYFLKLTLTNHSNIQAVYRDFTVHPKPDAHILSITPIQQCLAGNQFVLLDSSNALMPYQRFWSSSDSLVDTSSQIVYSRSTIGTTNWQLILIDSNSCTDTAHVVLETIPEPTFSIKTLSSVDICIGDSILLETDSVNTAWVYSLIKDGNTIDSNNSGQFWIQDTSTYRIGAISPLGCSSMSAAVHINILPLPPTPIIISPGSGDICNGDSVLLETDSVNTTWVYSLIKDGNAIDSNSSGQFWINDSSSYRIAALTPQGCSSTSAPVQINIHPIPAAPVIMGPDSIIGLDTSIFTTPSDTGLSFFWKSQGISFNTTSDSLVAVWIYEGNDTLSLYAVSRWGCKSEKAYHPIFIDMIPDSLVLSHDTLFANPYGDTLKMYVISNLTWNVMSVPSWTNFNKTSGTGIDSVLIIFTPNAGTGSRDFQVVFEADTLSDTLVLMQGTYLNLVNFVFREINMYPNPAFSGLQIVNQGNESVTIKIRNVSGVLIHETTLGGKDDLLVRVDGWKSGLYLVEIKNNHGSEFRKLLILH